MIDPQTTWAILVTPAGIAAGLGWMRCARLLAVARDSAAHWYEKAGRQMGKASAANCRAIDVEDRLRKIERQRSEATRRGNETRAAKHKALQAAKTHELRKQLGASVGERRIAA